MDNQEVKNFQPIHRPFVSNVNSLSQPSVCSTLALNQIHKYPTCKAAWSIFLLVDADAEVCTVKQG